MITKEANRLDISVKDFYDIIELYYKCDAWSYPFLKNNFFDGKEFNQNTKKDIRQLKEYIHYDIAA
jgi:hypothetical protein